MSDFDTEIEKVKSLLSFTSQADKSLGYSTLLYFQEQSTEQPSAIEALAKHINSLLSSAISDISDHDEEIAAQALKCLGFMIYHPSLVAAVSEDVAEVVVESLVKLITTTKMKAICNLAVWCISIQQFNASFLVFHFNHLLRAVIHALDNPIGSLSTTFEAIQAVTKMAAQLSEKMRDTSNIWAPVLYRRLLSVEKRQKDMAERCLQKITPILFPPPLALSKVLVADIKKKFLSEMKEMLHDHTRRIQTIQAWGWFIRLLGSHALKNRNLVNEMLKIPEQTFSDSDPQVQIASQVAWEGLIDALIHPQIVAVETKMAPEHYVHQLGDASPDGFRGSHNENKGECLLKSIRLIMTPLVGIMSSKCVVSVRSSCLNTWCYLLHKLDLSVNHPSLVKTVIEPILEVVLKMGPTDKNLWSWNFCLDLLDESILSKRKDTVYDSNCQVNCHLSTKISSLGLGNGGQYSCKDYLIKWLPWDLSKLDFHLNLICILINQVSNTTLSLEGRSLVCDAALRIFRSVLKGIQIELKKPTISFNEIMLCLNTILSLIKQVSEDVNSKESPYDNILSISIKFIEAVREELEPYLLSSPLYRVALDLKYINELQPVTGSEYPDVPEMILIKYMDNVSPMVYLTVLHFGMAAQSFSNVSQVELFVRGFQKHLEFIPSLYDPLEIIYVLVNLLYKHMTFSWLKIWIVVANILKEFIDSSSLKIETESNGYVAFCWFLSYPLVVCRFYKKLLTPVMSSCPSESCLTSSSLELEHVINSWRLLYSSLNSLAESNCSNTNYFAEDLSGILVKVLNQNTSTTDNSVELFLKDNNHDSILLPLLAEVAICLLSHLAVLGDEGLRSNGSNNRVEGYHMRSTGIRNSLDFTARLLKLSLAITSNDQHNDLISRVVSAFTNFIGRLHLRLDIVLVVEIFSDALVRWLSRSATIHVNMQVGSITCQLQHLWIETLNCLRRSRPPIIFDSSFLKVQVPILETTLEHPNIAISESTVAFWNSTYGNQLNLDYPQSLLPVLDKLSRKGRINIHKKSRPILKNAPLNYRVAATQNKISKRVEFAEDAWNEFEFTQMLMSGPKRKRLELTEHQKEVRRAQQGRERDCNGHGPGVRTYTSVDFSQDSQESQELRNPESILEMFRKT